MAKYFTLEEFLVYTIAKQKSIQNCPSWEVVEHLKELASFLDELREDWGSGINVSSGFRCNELNTAVGGVDNSLHKTGYAADVQPSNGKMKEFKEFVVNWLEGKDYDQAIIEKNKKTTWIHIGLYGPNMEQRKQKFSLDIK